MKGFAIAVVSALTFAAPVAGDAAAPRGVLAFARGGDIYVTDLATRQVRRLIATPAYEHSPSYSPDGARLLFVRERLGHAEIWSADAAGGNARRLTRAPRADYNPAWSPDGARIAFASNRRGAFRIYVMNADGTGVRLLAPRNRTQGGSFTPAWSPDGRLIAFASSAATPENVEIYVVRPNGTGLRRLTRTPGSVEKLGDDSWPAWSPDGKRIVFSSNRTGNGELWIMRADGRGQRRIAGLPHRDDWAAAFSPDGTRIAFHSLDARGVSRLYLVRPGGGALTDLHLRGEDATWRP